jgi:hypothetical protein
MMGNNTWAQKLRENAAQKAIDKGVATNEQYRAARGNLGLQRGGAHPKARQPVTERDPKAELFDTSAHKSTAFKQEAEPFEMDAPGKWGWEGLAGKEGATVAAEEAAFQEKMGMGKGKGKGKPRYGAQTLADIDDAMTKGADPGTSKAVMDPSGKFGYTKNSDGSFTIHTDPNDPMVGKFNGRTVKAGSGKAYDSILSLWEGKGSKWQAPKGGEAPKGGAPAAAAAAPEAPAPEAPAAAAAPPARQAHAAHAAAPPATDPTDPTGPTWPGKPETPTRDEFGVSTPENMSRERLPSAGQIGDSDLLANMSRAVNPPEFQFGVSTPENMSRDRLPSAGQMSDGDLLANMSRAVNPKDPPGGPTWPGKAETQTFEDYSSIPFDKDPFTAAREDAADVAYRKEAVLDKMSPEERAQYEPLLNSASGADLNALIQSIERTYALGAEDFFSNIDSGELGGDVRRR